MRKIKLQFSSSKGIFSRLIRWRDWSDYSHVDLILPDGRLLGARGDGVKIRDPYQTTCKVVLTCYVSDDQYDSIVMYAVSQLGKPYDYAGVLSFLSNRDWQEPDKWFCSELILYVFEAAGIKLLNTINNARYSPRDLMLSTLLHEELT